MRFGSWDATFDGELTKWNVRAGDVISFQRSRDSPALLLLEACKHPIQYEGMCAVCGMNMEGHVLFLIAFSPRRLLKRLRVGLTIPGVQRVPVQTSK